MRNGNGRNVSDCYDSLAYVAFFVALARFCEQCLALYRAVCPVRSTVVAHVQPMRSGWVLPCDAFRCVLGEADVYAPASRPVSVADANLTRDGYDMGAIQPRKATRNVKPRKASKVAAQTVATESPAFVAPVKLPPCETRQFNLDTADYRTLQHYAKQEGIRANQSATALREQLRERGY